VTFLCACAAAVPELPVREKGADVLVVRPAGYQPVALSRDELRDGMRMLFSRGPLPGMPRGEAPRFSLASADPWQLQKAAGYLDHCARVGGGARRDCWEVLTPAGGLDGSGTREVALRIAFAEAIQDAASAVQSLTPEQVRAILGAAVLGTIIGVLSPDPVSKVLVIVTATNLIAFVGVDLFNSLVRGYAALAEELAGARDFAAVQAAGERYGQRLGPTLARIVVMVATYGVAKLAGLFPGNATSLPGGSRAAALAETQGFRIPAAEGARSIVLAADGSVAIEMGTVAAMATEGDPGSASAPRPQTAFPGRTSEQGGKSTTIAKGIGGKGWRGDRDWREAVRQVERGGTIESIGGKVPTKDEAVDLITEAGGNIERIDLTPHAPPNPHQYPHINYTTASGGRGTVRIQ
jgi:hypothetical protein